MAARLQSMARQAVSACLLLGVSVVFSLAVAEGILRLGLGVLPLEIHKRIQASPNNLGVEHPYIGHLHKPHSTGVLSGRDFTAVHHTDGFGFRNAWPWPKRAEIVVVGDSVTFGYGVEDTKAWPALLAHSLPQSPVINLGLIGAGPQQYLRVYETFGVKLHPKVLLVGFWTRNDFWDADLFDRWSKSGVGGNYMVWRDFGRPKKTGFDPQEPVGSLIKTLRWRIPLLARSSYLYNLLLEVRSTARTWSPSEVRTFQFSDGSRVRLYPGDFVRKIEGARPERREFSLALRALQRMQSIADENRTHLLIVLQPSKEEVYVPLLGEAIPDASRPLRVALKKLGISFLDLTPIFRARAAQGERLYFETDGHPDARGYALIAEGILAHLRENAKRYGLTVKPGS